MPPPLPTRKEGSHLGLGLLHERERPELGTTYITAGELQPAAELRKQLYMGQVRNARWFTERCWWFNDTHADTVKYSSHEGDVRNRSYIWPAQQPYSRAQMQK